MKVFVVLVMIVLVAASALTYGAVSSSVTSAAVQVADSASEPAVLLLSGSLLLGLAGAVKRFTL